jgi:hypothetical protein
MSELHQDAFINGIEANTPNALEMKIANTKEYVTKIRFMEIEILLENTNKIPEIHCTASIQRDRKFYQNELSQIYRWGLLSYL